MTQPPGRTGPAPHHDGPPDLTTVSGRLRYARELRGLATRALGAAAGLSTAAVHKIEHAPDGGARAGVATVEALAKVLDVPAQWLAFGLGPPPSRA